MSSANPNHPDTAPTTAAREQVVGQPSDGMDQVTSGRHRIIIAWDPQRQSVAPIQWVDVAQ